MLRVIASIVFLVLLFCQTSAAKCVAERRPYADQPTGQLVATEYAVMLRESFCPDETISIDAPISIQQGTKLWFWFRLQGDTEFLRRRDSGEQLVLTFNYGDNLHRVKSLNLGYINREKARREAKKPGLFDWRTNAAKWSLDIPGTYTIWIEQGGDRVCIIPSHGFECGLVFSVE